jgi:hypothetical protein
MNERIKKLAEQASHQSPDGYPVTIPYSKDFAEKFAELIVKECSNYIGNKAMLAGGACTIVGEEGLWLSKDLLEHFGVEK